MPPLIPVGGALKIAISGKCSATSDWSCIFHWSYGGTEPSQADCAALALLARTTFSTEFTPLMTEAMTITQAEVIDLASAMGSSAIDAATTTGSRTGGVLPASAAVLVHKTTQLRYRGGHPRTYLPCGSATDINTADTWSADLVSAVNGAYNVFQGSLNAHTQGGTTLGNEIAISYVNKVANPIPPFRRAAPLVLPILDFATEAAIATVRRRLGRR